MPERPDGLPRAVALICARGGSKGLPGKNVRLFGGRPLLTWAIEHAKAVARISRVVVSTDSPEIAGVAREAGADVPFLRPAELAADDSPEWMVWRHALAHLREQHGGLPSALMVVPATAPLRAVDDLERCMDEYEKGAADVVITVTDANRSPYFNMVTVDDRGASSLVIPPVGSAVARRQAAPVVYDMTTVAYVVKPEFVMTHEGIFEGQVRQVHVPVERAVDIDTALDFEWAEYLYSRRAGR